MKVGECMTKFNWHESAEKKWDSSAEFWNQNSQEMWDSGSRSTIIPFFEQYVKKEDKCSMLVVVMGTVHIN